MLKALASTAVLVLVLPQAAPPAREVKFSPDRMKAHVTFLADDELEGREAGSRGHAIAARYIAAQFALDGVQPAGRGESYFEDAQFAETSVVTARPVLRVTTPMGNAAFEQGETMFVGAAVGAGTVSIRGDLVFAGYGLADRTLGYDDYKGLNVAGRIVVVLWGAPTSTDSEIAAHLQDEQMRVAAEHGAVGMIRIALMPWEVVKQFGNQPNATWVRPSGELFDHAPGLKCMAVVEPAAAEALFNGSPTPLARIRQDMSQGARPAGFAMPATAELTFDTRTRRFSSPEVVGVIEGRDPQLRHEYVALMAHADHIGISAGGAGDRINNGALDNAAGVATLLEVAHAFATAGRPRRSILLVANTAEEKGLLGADYFAHYPTVPIDHITAAIDLDMPLLLYDFTDVVAFGATHSTVGQAFARAGAAMHVALSPDPMPEQAIFVRSDHYAMVKAGVPAVMLATGMANGGDAAWKAFLATRYHQPSDDLSQAIVWTAGAKFAELNFRAVRILADDAQPARWYEHDYFGDLYAPQAARVPRPARE